MNAAQYRSNLEKEKAEIMDLLEHHETHGRRRLVGRLREIVDELNRLDEGESWTQEPSDTKARIVIAEISGQRKVLR